MLNAAAALDDLRSPPLVPRRLWVTEQVEGVKGAARITDSGTRCAFPPYTCWEEADFNR